MRRPGAASLAAALIALILAQPAASAAEPVESFYAGKTIQMLIGFGAGGGYDLYGRTVARFLGRHLPGNPTVVPQNMPGAGSVRAAGYLYTVAPKDGSVIGTFSRGTAADTLLGDNGAQFDPRKFAWLGSVTNEVSVCGFWTSSGIRDWQDMLTRDSTVGSSGATDDTAVYPNVLRNLFKARLKVIAGYPGTADMVLGLERSELGGICGWSWSTLLGRSRSAYEAGKINVTLQLALTPHEDLPKVPLVLSLTKDPKVLAALRLIFSRQTMARPFAAPPGIPADRETALRAAFDATMKDPDFLDEARKLDLEVRPVSGAAIEVLIAKLYAAPPDVVKLAIEAIKGGP